MSIFSHSPPAPHEFVETHRVSSSALGSVAVLLATTLVIALLTPKALVLPMLALAATLYAAIAGIAARFVSARARTRATVAAGVFALAAAAAAMLGDPDQVARLFG